MLATARPERLVLLSLLVFATVVGAAMVVFPDEVPITTIILPMVMGGLFLGPRPLPWFVIYNLALLTAALPVWQSRHLAIEKQLAGSDPDSLRAELRTLSRSCD